MGGVTVPAWALPPSPVRTRAMIGPAPVAPAMTWQPLSGVTAPAATTTPLRLLEPAPAAMYLATANRTGTKLIIQMVMEPKAIMTMDISARHVLLVHCVPLMLRAVMAVETRMACADTHHAPRPLAAWLLLSLTHGII